MRCCLETLRNMARRPAGAARGAASRGAIALEFGLIIPVIVAVFMGVMELGNAYQTWLTLQKACQEGARYASTGQGEQQGTRLSDVMAAVRELASHLDQSALNISVQSWKGIEKASVKDNNAGLPCETVEVSANYRYKPITPLFQGFALPEIPLTGSDRKINEPWQPCKK